MEGMSSLVPKTISSLGLAKEYRHQFVLVNWKEIVGEEIATHAWPVRAEKGILTVNASNSAWMHHLFLLKEEIIGKINTYMKDKVIQDIRFRAGSVKRIQFDTEELEPLPLYVKLKTVRLDDKEVTEAKRLVEPIQDEKLKQRFLNLLFKHAAYNKLKKQEGWQPCQNCGVYSPPGQIRCMACTVQEKSKLTAAIIACLKQAPWQKYQDCQKEVPCSITDFIYARQQYMNRLMELVKKGQASKNEETALVMLATGLSPLLLTDKIVAQQLDKFRRKKDVSAPRS